MLGHLAMGSNGLMSIFLDIFEDTEPAHVERLGQRHVCLAALFLRHCANRGGNDFIERAVEYRTRLAQHFEPGGALHLHQFKLALVAQDG